MSYSLESALVIVLREAIKWEASIETSPGVLVPITATAAIDPSLYQHRDRQLAFRDLLTASAIIEASVHTTAVWNCPVAAPKLQGPVTDSMPAVGTATDGLDSLVAHAGSASAPFAATLADADLYGRDCLIHETLARACEIFTDPPVTSVDTSHVVSADGILAWSKGEGDPSNSSVNGALPLNVDTFKKPDQNLADRDNQLAGYTARLVQVLKNPFAHATRLYVQIDGATEADAREAEVYALVSESVTERVWTCEPALSNRNRIVYSVLDKTLRWVGGEDVSFHRPQIVALAIPGIASGQQIKTLAALPTDKDCQYWRSKAAQVKPAGLEIKDLPAYTIVNAVDSDTGLPIDTGIGTNNVLTGGVTQPDSASLTVPGTIHFPFKDLTGLPKGHYRVSLLTQACPTVTILGNQNACNTSGLLGRADYAAGVAALSGLTSNTAYRVIGGSGITYPVGSASHYYAGDTFNRDSTNTSYARLAGAPSVVNQYEVKFSVPLPPGPWTVSLGYTNVSDTADSFGIQSQMLAANQINPVNVIQDASSFPFTVSNGVVVQTPPVAIDVPYVDPAVIPPFTLSVFWTSDAGQLGLQSLTFTSLLPLSEACSYNLTGSMAGKTSGARVTLDRMLPEVIRFDFDVTTAPATNNFDLTWICDSDLLGQSKYVPLKIKQVHVQCTGTNYVSTPLSDEFQSWRQECIERAESSVQHCYRSVVGSYGTNIPVICGNGSSWESTQSEAWMSLVEVGAPRTREINGIVAATELVPGHQYEVLSGSAVYRGATYNTAGTRFYAVSEWTGSAYTSQHFTGNGVIKQVGAFMKAKPGHVGKPCLMPNGLHFTSAGTVASNYTTDKLTPTIVSCQPWMIDIGLYVAQPEFWQPEWI